MGVALALAACGGHVPGSAAPQGRSAAPSLTSAERAALLDGTTVSRPLRIQKGTAKSVGGIAYQLVRATPEEVLSALQSVDSLPEALPRTQSAKLVGLQGDVAYIELVQGTDAASAVYTIQLQRVDEREIRFWLDRSRPHDIENVWGYFRAERFDADQTLVTMAVALDLGPGLMRMFFEDRIEQVILDAPRQIREFVEPRAYASF